MKLRQALEDSESSPNPEEQAQIIMKGPLADIYTQALDVALAKEADPAAGSDVPAVTEVVTALETQQMDATLMNGLAKLLNAQGADGAPETSTKEVVYSVGAASVSEDDVVEVAKDLVATDGGDFVLIVDGTAPSVNGEAGGAAPVERGAALECMVNSFGGKVYHSFGEWLKSKPARRRR